MTGQHHTVGELTERVSLGSIRHRCVSEEEEIVGHLLPEPFVDDLVVLHLHLDVEDGHPAAGMQ